MATIANELEWPWKSLLLYEIFLTPIPREICLPLLVVHGQYSWAVFHSNTNRSHVMETWNLYAVHCACDWVNCKPIGAALKTSCNSLLWALWYWCWMGGIKWTTPLPVGIQWWIKKGKARSWLGLALCVPVSALTLTVGWLELPPSSQHVLLIHRDSVLDVLPSVLWCCWLGGRKGIRPVKNEWWGTGVVICLERGTNDLHMVQLMPLLSHYLLLQ